MNTDNRKEDLDKARRRIAETVRSLREERRWTQAELSKRLRLSQGRLSELERGDGSFTAEQFLTILKLFNIPATQFAPQPPDEETDLQNALARLGAPHLQENSDVLPSERLHDATTLVRETLVAAERPRLVTALAPVLVRNIERINLKNLDRQLFESGFERRLAWLVDNTREAIRRELPQVTSRQVSQLYRRAEIVFGTFLEVVTSARRAPSSLPDLPDVLDADIRSKESLEEAKASSSVVSRRWGILTSLQPEDFVDALRAARAGA